MNILVTGAAGFLGSTFAFEVLNEGHNVIGVDNFCNSTDKNIKLIQKHFPDSFNFYEIDLSECCKGLESYLKRENIEAVVHFAGLKAVGESESKPILYWENNLISTFNLVKVMRNLKIKNIIFSSSATVYGNNQNQPLTEDNALSPMSCYGSTKISNEFFLKDISKFNEFNVISLRYFNPVGAHKEKVIFEEYDQQPNNLMPRIIRVAKKIDQEILVFGKDYETRDGTGERDYIHVSDLVDAHICAMGKITRMKGFNVFNIGTGDKTSVLELISTFEEQNNVKIPYQIAERRDGDVAICYADPTEAKKVLGWKSKFNLAAMCKDSWDAVKNGTN